MQPLELLYGVGALLLAACALNERDYYGAGYSKEQVAREAADCEMKAEAGKTYELWAVGGGRAAPQSLGVIDASLKIPTEYLGKVDPATLGETVFAISLEPQGGSPTGAPTGPVLYTGKLVATE